MRKHGKESRLAVRHPTEIRPWRFPNMERMLDEPFRPFSRSWMNYWRPQPFRLDAPAIDIYEDKSSLVVKAEIPGLLKDEIDVSVNGNMLTIKGEKRKEEEVKEKNYYRSERSFGSFVRTLELPTDVHGDKVKATFKDGILEVRLPKTEEAEKKEIKVKVD